MQTKDSHEKIQNLPQWFLEAERNFSGLEEFVTRWLDVLTPAGVITVEKRAEILDNMGYDSAVGLWAAASFSTNSGLVMPAWVENIFAAIAAETPGYSKMNTLNLWRRNSLPNNSGLAKTCEV